MSEHERQAETEPAVKLIELDGTVIPLTGIDYLEANTKQGKPGGERRNWRGKLLEQWEATPDKYRIEVSWAKNSGHQWGKCNLVYTTASARDAAYSKLVAALAASGVMVSETAAEAA